MHISLISTQKQASSEYVEKSSKKVKSKGFILTRDLIRSSFQNNIKEIDHIKRNNSVFTDTQTICEQFNNFFINQTNCRQRPVCAHTGQSHDLSKTVNTMFLTPVDEHDIIKIIRSLKNTNATCYDDISTSVLKIVSSVVAKLIAI